MALLRYILKKLGYMLVTLWGVITLIFILFNVLPDPATLTLGQRSDVQTEEMVRKELGLDLPAFTRYLHYLNDVSPLSIHERSGSPSEKYREALEVPLGDKVLLLKAPYFRRSFQSKKEVSTILAESFEGTFYLSVAAMGIAVLLGIMLGVSGAIAYNSWLDRVILFISTIGISAPSFFAAIIIAWFFGFVLADYTGLSMTGSLTSYDLERGRFYDWKNLVLPAFALGIRPLAIITQLTRSSMLDVMSQDYIRTAYAKGFSTSQVVRRHALKNALNPVVTSISGWFASLLAGAFFVEYIFNWKGIGKVTVDALEKADYPVVTGAVLLVAFIFISLNLVVDLLYKVLDPRVKI